jgi:hypothetical protein
VLAIAAEFPFPQYPDAPVFLDLGLNYIDGQYSYVFLWLTRLILTISTFIIQGVYRGVAVPANTTNPTLQLLSNIFDGLNRNLTFVNNVRAMPLLSSLAAFLTARQMSGHFQWSHHDVFTLWPQARSVYCSVHKADLRCSQSDYK